MTAQFLWTLFLVHVGIVPDPGDVELCQADPACRRDFEHWHATRL